MKSCFIYCRVSTEEQAEKGYSLDAQEKFCRDFATRNGYVVAGVFRDEGKSATNLDRPALKELLSKCTGSGSSISAVVVQETDRLARNTSDHLGVKAVLRKSGVKLLSVAQPMLDDSPEGMMVDTILASVNQFQSDINSRKTKRGMQEKFDQGWWPSLAPLGYINAPLVSNPECGRPINVVRKDITRWDFILEGFRMYLTGYYSVAQINDTLHEKGLRSRNGKKLSISVMSGILTNPFYAGLMVWNNQRRTGRHEPMITLEEHESILQIMDAHNLNACRRRKHDFLLRGFVICNICGQKYTAERHPAKQKDYYHCAGRHSHRGQNVEVSVLESEIESRFRTIQFTDDFIETVVSQLRSIYLEEKDAINIQKQALYNQKKAIEVKRDKVEDKLFNGVISDDDFIRLRTQFSEKLAAVQRQLLDLDYHLDMDIDAVHEVLKLSRNVYQAYKKAPYELKRQYLGIFWESFIVEDRRIVEAVPTKLFRQLLEEKRVIIRGIWGPSPKLIITLRDKEYMTSLKAMLDSIVSLSYKLGYMN